MKLNSFGETIRRIEAERLAEAQKAIGSGWTEADHPAKCCPPVIAPRQSGKTARSIEEIRRLHDKATNRRKWWEDALKRREQALSDHEASIPKFDHGMMQLSLKYRQRGLSKGEQLWQATEEAKSKIAHYTNLTMKYTKQLERLRK
ncbi:MAG: hypothetical protein ACTH2A_06780 [Glutamicibacter ardleyensis]